MCLSYLTVVCPEQQEAESEPVVNSKEQKPEASTKESCEDAALAEEERQRLLAELIEEDDRENEERKKEVMEAKRERRRMKKKKGKGKYKKGGGYCSAQLAGIEISESDESELGSDEVALPKKKVGKKSRKQRRLQNEEAGLWSDDESIIL